LGFTAGAVSDGIADGFSCDFSQMEFMGILGWVLSQIAIGVVRKRLSIASFSHPRHRNWLREPGRDLRINDLFH
jgi:hypothetical protein